VNCSEGRSILGSNPHIFDRSPAPTLVPGLLLKWPMIAKFLPCRLPSRPPYARCSFFCNPLSAGEAQVKLLKPTCLLVFDEVSDTLHRDPELGLHPQEQA